MELPAIQRLIRQLRRQLKDFPRNPDPRSVHRLRTRIRQLLAIADIAPAINRKSIKPLTSLRKSAGRVRDLDVLSQNAQTLSQELGEDSLVGLQRKLDKNRRKSARALQKTIEDRQKLLLNGLNNFTRQIQPASASSGNSKTSEVFRGLENNARQRTARLRLEFANWPDPDDENLHDLRKKVKTLRTLLHLLAESDQDEIKALGFIASRIGDWHDWQRMAGFACKNLGGFRNSMLIHQIERSVDLHFERAIQAAQTLRVKYPKPVRSYTLTNKSEHQDQVA